MVRTSLAIACALLVTVVAGAQTVTEIPTASRNPAGLTLDLEAASGAPALGPISGTEPYWTTNGILSVSIVNQPGAWSPGDTLNSPSTGVTTCLASVNNSLALVGQNAPMDNPTVGAGFGFLFAGVCTQFGFEVLDQAGLGLSIEAYLGGSLVGSVNTTVPSIPSTLTFDIVSGCDEIRVISTSSGGWVMDNIFLVVGGTPPTPDYQPNSDLLALTIDGAQGNEFFPFVTNRDVFPACGPTATSVEFALSSDAPGTLYDIAVSTGPSVGASMGGFTLPGLRINFDLFQPYSFVASNGPLPEFVPMPGVGIPGLISSSWSSTLNLTTAGTFTLQAIVLDAAAPAGLNGTCAAQIDTVAQPIPVTLAGPTLGTTNVNYDLTSAPNCWTTSGVPFYGTLFNDIYVSPNGFVAFGAGGDTDTSPSVFDALNDDGRVGFWTSFDPSEGGTVDLVYGGPDTFSVDYNAVFYDGGGPACTFSILFDCLSGSITIDGLQGLVANPNTTSTTDDQWLGISPGIGVAGLTAADPGAQAFGAGGAGGAANPGDMLYEFNDVSVSASGLPASVVGGMNTLLLLPDGNGNYTWAGF